MSKVQQTVAQKKFNKYDIEYARSIDPQQREKFWGEQSDEITWFNKGPRVLDSSRPPFYTWFKDYELNMCYNCIDRHLPKLANKRAVIVESFLANVSKVYTYKELHSEVTKVAGVMRDLGVKAGDRVVIFMPMIGEAIFSIFATQRVGAIHSIVFGGFASKELASRITDCKPTLIIASSCGLEGQKKIDYKIIIDEALDMVKDPKIKVLLVQRPQLPSKRITPGRDFDYHTLVPKAKPFLHCVPRKAQDPLYILYTSGTTGTPKGIVRDIGGTAVAINYTMKKMMDIQEGDCYFSTSDIGWVVGHTFIIYGPLLRGAATIIYEGKPTGTPDPASCWKLIEKHKVNGFYTAPTAIRAIRKDDPNGDYIKKYNLKSLKCISMAGERLDVPTYKWFKSFFPNILLNDNYWQTESGWIISGNYMNLHTFPVKPGSACKPCPGWEIIIVDEQNNEIPRGKMGKIMIKLPLPPSFMSTLYNNDQAFVEKYFNDKPGYYTAGDAGFMDEDGYLNIMTRIDDIINTAGHRLSTAAMEEILLTHKDLVEAAVVSQNDNLKGEVPVGFICVKQGINPDPKKLKQECINLVRNEIGPVAAFRDVIIVKQLPKTRSGKIIRALLKKMLDNEPYKIPPTIDDVSVLPIIKQAIDEERVKTQQKAKL